MTSLKFPDNGTRMAVGQSGKPESGGAAVVYADAPCTTLAEIYTDLGGVKGPRNYSAALALDSFGQQPDYWGPADGTDRLYVSVNGRRPGAAVDADYNLRIDAVETLPCVQVPAPTGSTATDTAAVQAALDAGAALGAARVRLVHGRNYTVSGVTIDTGVWLDLNSGGMTLADGSNNYLVSTTGYASLVGTDSTGGPRDWAIFGGYLDGGKAGQSAIDKPVLAIYGRAYRLKDLTIRNGKGTGVDSEWSTTSPFSLPNGFESFVNEIYVHSCDGDGVNFRGPHDAYWSDFFVVKCAPATFAPIRLPDASGRANGSNFDKFHIYGGNGYSYGLLVNTAGTKFTNFVVEGAQTAQCLIQASQVQFDAAHLYSGGVNTANVKGIQVGDATHTGINGLSINAKIENCGGGAFDFANMGDHNMIRSHVYYYTGTTPALSTIGFVGTPTRYNDIQLYVADNTFVPTVNCLNQTVGPLKSGRVSTADTRDMVDIRDDAGTAMYTIDYRGRPRSKSGATPTIANGAQIGTGAPSTSITGTDHAGTVSITTGTGPAAGQLATVTFSAAFGATPRAVVLTPKDSGAAALQPFVTTAASAFSVRVAVAPAAATTYGFDYIVIGS